MFSKIGQKVGQKQIEAYQHMLAEQNEKRLKDTIEEISDGIISKADEKIRAIVREELHKHESAKVAD